MTFDKLLPIFLKISLIVFLFIIIIFPLALGSVQFLYLGLFEVIIRDIELKLLSVIINLIFALFFISWIICIPSYLCYLLSKKIFKNYDEIMNIIPETYKNKTFVINILNFFKNLISGGLLKLITKILFSIFIFLVIVLSFFYLKEVRWEYLF